jgi:hypothetical protein
MPSRLGGAYQHDVTPTDTYQILNGDDLINPLIASDKTMTLPLITGLGPDDRKKIIGNDANSVGLATYAAASGDAVRGTAIMNPGQYVEIFAEGRTWTIGVGGTATSASSTADSKGVSAGTRASVADSKAVSDSVIASANDSNATSRSVSNSTVISSLTSRVSSKGN